MLGRFKLVLPAMRDGEKGHEEERPKRAGNEAAGTIPTEQVFEGQSFVMDVFQEVFGPTAKAEMWKECVKCGRTFSGLVPEADPRWFIQRLITEFVQESRKELCDRCLSELYEHLGRCVQANWQRSLKTKTL